MNYVDWARIWISIYYNDFILNFVYWAKKSGTGLTVESSIQPVPGGFSAKTLCLSPTLEYVPGTWISTESALYGHAMRFLLIRLYLSICIA